MVKRARMLAVVALLTMACSAPANLTGEISVAGKSAEARRDVEVILLPASEAFETEWNRTVKEFQTRRARASAVAKEAQDIQAQAAADRSAASQSAQRVLQARNDRSRSDIDWKAYDQATQRQNQALEKLFQAGRRVRDAEVQIEKMGPLLRAEAWDLIKKYQMLAVRTDEAGRFEFKGTAPGRYFLASRLRVAGNELYWLVPLDLKSRAKHLTHLTEANAGWPFSAERPGTPGRGGLGGGLRPPRLLRRDELDVDAPLPPVGDGGRVAGRASCRRLDALWLHSLLDEVAADGVHAPLAQPEVVLARALGVRVALQVERQFRGIPQLADDGLEHALGAVVEGRPIEAEFHLERVDHSARAVLG